MIFLILHIILAIAAGILLWWWRKREHNIMWSIVLYSLVGIMIYAIIAILYFLLPILTILWFIVTTGSAIAATVFVFTHWHHPEYFVKKDISQLQAKPGKISVIFEMKNTNSAQLFIKETKKGKKGLCISRVPPETMRQQFPEISESLWLSADEGGKVSPQDLEELSYTLNSFLDKEKENGVILFDGFTYLVNYHDFNKIMHMFAIIKDKVSKNNALLIMPVASKTLEAQNTKSIRAEMEVLE